MSLALNLSDDLAPPVDGEWWYRATGGTSGPVSTAELRRLSSGGPLDGDTPVWRKGDGAHWRRLAEALAPAQRSGPPAADHGRWAKTFAAIEANPRKLRWSWLGLLGPIAYLCLGMWRKALVIVTAAWLVYAVIGIAQWERGSHVVGLPAGFVLMFCAQRLKTDLYRHRVLGETMWPALRVMAPAWVCGPVAAVAFLALVLVKAANPADAMLGDVAGVWQSGEGATVVLDVGGTAKRIAYGTHKVTVQVEKVDDDGEGLVFDVLWGEPKRIAVRKHWSDDHATYTLDVYQGDELMANVAFLKPV